MSSLPHRPTTVTVEGNPQYVANVIRGHDSRGTLVSATYPRPVGHGLVSTDLVILTTAAQQAVDGPRWTVGRTAGTLAVAGSAAILGALVTVLILAVQWIAAHLAAIVGTLLILIVVLAVLTASRVTRPGGTWQGSGTWTSR